MSRNAQLSGELINDAPWHYDQGLLIYDQNGHMSVQLMNNNRPSFANGDLVTAVKESKPESLSAAVLGYLAYFGTYTATATSGQKGVIIHHVQVSTNNYAGSDQKRAFELTDSQLILTKLTNSAQTTKGDLTSRIVWERL